MEDKERLRLAQLAYAKRYSQRVHILTWRSSGEPEIYSGVEGFEDLAARLGVLAGTLNNYISRGHGSFSITRTNPLTGEPDVATVTRRDPAKVKRPVGRPRKMENWERLGYTQEPEFFPRPQQQRNRTGTNLASKRNKLKD
jgi:transcriptional regulator with XRE-family HTH domain